MCVLPFLHFYIAPNSQILPCCYTTNFKPFGKFSKQSAGEVLNLPMFKDFRRDLAVGKSRPDICSRCYQEEKYSGASHRTRMNEHFVERIPGILKDMDADGHLREPKMLFWDVRFSNLCNFKCRVCGPGYSSAWATELTNNGIPSKLPAAEQLEETKFSMLLEHIPFVEEIYFAGGEPLMTDSHYLLLEALIERKRTNVKLIYNSNASIFKFKKWNVLEMWRKFPSVVFGPSLDEVGERAEYIRKGTEWPEIVANIQHLKKTLPHVEIVPTFTVSVFNVLRVRQVLEEFWRLNLVQPKTRFLLNLVETPGHFNLQVLPKELRSLELEKLRAWRHELWSAEKLLLPQLDVLEGAMGGPASGFQAAFFENVQMMDRIRNENFATVLPDLAMALHDQKSQANVESCYFPSSFPV
jgi:sulfatase maturation enzyme AslB (radical SAM superfamily)